MTAISSPRRLELLIASAIFLAGFSVYIVTLCPSTDFIDAGELTTVGATLGIAHPTGYPLFTLFAWLFAHLPIPFRVVFKLNLMAAVFCAAGLFVFYRFLVHFLTAVAPPPPPARGAGTAAPHQGEGVPLRTILRVFLPAAAGTLALAFSETYWSQAVAIEVYSLHLFLTALLLLTFTKAAAPLPGTPPAATGSSWYLFAFVLGLAFTNHMTTILLAPGFLYLYFSTFGGSKETWKLLGRLACPFLAGLSLYLYLPLRAAQHPLMDWGNPVDFERFLWHFSGKQYRVWIFSSTESAGRQLAYFWGSVLPEFAYLPVLLSGVGLVSLWRERRRAAVFTLLLFLGCILYSINYDIHDIDSYFLLAYIAMAVWAARGAAHLIGLVKRQESAKQAAAALLVIALFPLAGNFGKVDESGNVLVEKYTRDMFASVAPGGIILTYQWDYFVSAAYYFQIVEELRPDVVVVDKELLRRSWYFIQLGKRYPWLLEQSRKELDAYLAELRKFEHGLPYDNGTIEFRYREFIRSILLKNAASHPLYATGEVEAPYTSGFNRVPAGLAFRLFADTLFHDPADPPYAARAPSTPARYGANLQSIYARSYLNSALYLEAGGKKERALACVDSALEIEPEMREAADLREKILGKGSF